MNKFIKYILKYVLGYALFLLIVFLLSSARPKADTFIPTSKLQYYEGYEENSNTGDTSFHEDGYSYGSNITPPLSPGFLEHPFAISLLLDGSYKAGNTYIFTATLYTNLKGSTFKFYYPELLYMAWFARLGYKDEKVTCNFDMITENKRFDITCHYQPSADSNRATISFVNQDWKNNGYLTYDDVGTYFKWDNINIQLYSDSSGVIIEQNQTIINQNQTIIDQNNKTNKELEKTNDLLTDDTAPDLDIDSMVGWLPVGPVDSILNLPLTFFNSLTTNLSKTCKPINVPLPYLDKSYELPCIKHLFAKFGSFSTIWNLYVGTFVSVLILYSYLLRLYKYIDETLKFRDSSDISSWGGV